eukprot:9479328-Pyramimonas_sp.AAC.1
MAWAVFLLASLSGTGRDESTARKRQTLLTVEAHARKHPAGLQGAPGFFLGSRWFCHGKRDVPTPKINGRPGVS